MSEIMDIIPDNVLLKGKVPRQTIKEYKEVGFELPNPMTDDEIREQLNAVKMFSDASTLFNKVDNVLWISINHDELDKLKPKEECPWQLKKDYMYGDFKQKPKSEMDCCDWHDEFIQSSEVLELKHKLDESFESINHEIGTVKGEVAKAKEV